MAGRGATLLALLVAVASFTSWQTPVQANSISAALDQIRQSGAPAYVSVWYRVNGAGMPIAAYVRISLINSSVVMSDNTLSRGGFRPARRDW